MSTAKILDLLRLAPPPVYEIPRKILEVEGTDPELLYGIELEIENLDEDEDRRANRKVPGMEYHKDGSLRNYGGEFVTKPMRRNTLNYVLNQFFEKNKLDADNYSERCSVHVHANCGDLTSEQLRLVLCLYQILERVLFNFVKGDRDGNIFCVPWSESLIGSKILSSPDVLIAEGRYSWRKYTALNILPLYTQGTIEFRHMPGTADRELILDWCDIIGCMFKYARTHEFNDVVGTLMNLNTSSAYANFMMDIFTPDLYDKLAAGPYREYLEEGVLNMKIMLATNASEEKIEVESLADRGYAFQNNMFIMDDVLQPAAYQNAAIDWGPAQPVTPGNNPLNIAIAQFNRAAVEHARINPPIRPRRINPRF